MPEMEIRRTTSEKLYAYIDAERDVRIEASRIEDGDWRFSIHGSTETVYLRKDAADLAQQFIREVLEGPCPTCVPKD